MNNNNKRRGRATLMCVVRTVAFVAWLAIVTGIHRKVPPNDGIDIDKAETASYLLAPRTLASVKSAHSTGPTTRIHSNTATKSRHSHERQKSTNNKQANSQYQTESSSTFSQLVIHVGPSKTGTTTIQKDCKHLMDSGILRQDNYVYHGRYVTDAKYQSLSKIFDVDCIEAYKLSMAESKGRNATASCWLRMRQKFDDLRLRNMSVIMSDEAWSYKNTWQFHDKAYFSALKDLFGGWNVTIVLGYRHLFEWLLSAAKERNAGASYSVWPHQGGKDLEQMWPIVRTWIHGSDFVGKGITARFYKYIDSSIPTWTAGGFTPSILNLHSTQPITTALFCDIARNAPFTCAYLKNQSKPTKVNQKSTSLSIYNQIVYTAAKRGLWTREMMNRTTRIQAAIDLQHYYQGILGKSVINLPMICPTASDLNDLLMRSLRFEKEWMPVWYAANKEMHAQAFHKTALENMEFCGIDLHRLFNQTNTWSKFLHSLNTTKPWPIRHEK